MDLERLRLYAYMGLITPVVGFIVIFLAISSAPWFKWTGNALSDLGVRGTPALIFNNGLMLTAALMAVFCLGLRETEGGDSAGQVGWIMFLIASTFLLGVGIFPETAGRIHYYVSVGFFVSMPLALFAFTAHLYRGGEQRLAVFTVALGLFSALVWTPSWDGVAIPEAASALAVGVWAVTMSLRMLRKAEN